MNNKDANHKNEIADHGVREPEGADLWRRPPNRDDREFLERADVEIDSEMEKYCPAAVPLQCIGDADFRVLESAVAVACSLAERDVKEDDEQRGAEPVPVSPAELTARRGKVLRLYTLRHYTPLLALILYRTTCNSINPQTT